MGCGRAGPHFLRYKLVCECVWSTYLKVELAELLLGVDVRVARHDYGTGGERYLSIRRLAVIRGDGGQAAIVPELLVQNGGGMARRRCLHLADVVQAQQERQDHDAEHEDAAGAATQYFVHDFDWRRDSRCSMRARRGRSRFI